MTISERQLPLAQLFVRTIYRKHRFVLLGLFTISGVLVTNWSWYCWYFSMLPYITSKIQTFKYLLVILHLWMPVAGFLLLCQYQSRDFFFRSKSLKDVLISKISMVIFLRLLQFDLFILDVFLGCFLLTIWKRFTSQNKIKKARYEYKSINTYRKVYLLRYYKFCFK